MRKTENVLIMDIYFEEDEDGCLEYGGHVGVGDDLSEFDLLIRNIRETETVDL